MKNKILSGLVNAFSADFCIDGEADFKKFEYFASYLNISRFDPEYCEDADRIKEFDVDSSGTYGIDSIFFVVNGNIVKEIEDIRPLLRSKSLDIRIVITQAKTSESLDAGEFLKFASAVKFFFEEDEVNNDLAWAKEVYKYLFSDECVINYNLTGPRCELHYVYAGRRQAGDGIFSDVVEQQRSDLERQLPDMRGGFSVFVDDSELLIDAYNEVKNKFSVNVDLKNNVPLEDIDGVDKAYLAYIGLDDFLPLVTGPDGRIRSHVFYENVRDFQGDNPVNTEIQGTIADKSSHDKFVLLNNGITIITREMVQLGGKKFKISKFFIVNGCQTSHVIFNNREALKGASDFYIPIKIIHTQSSDLISRVIRATNKQTSIPDEAFAALENFHKRLQQFYAAKSHELSERLIYERRLKEFLQDEVVGYKIVSLHRQIRAWVAVIEGSAWSAVKENPSGMFKSRLGRLFQDSQAYEPYYFSAYLVSKFYDFQLNNVFSDKYALFRYHIAYAVIRILMNRMEVPTQGNEARKYFALLEEKIRKKEEFDKVFVEAFKWIVGKVYEFKKDKGISLTEISRSRVFFEQIKDGVELKLVAQKLESPVS